jgi:hypothetical protein
MAGTCEYGKEPSGFIKCGKFLAKTGQLLKKDSAPWSKFARDSDSGTECIGSHASDQVRCLSFPCCIITSKILLHPAVDFSLSSIYIFVSEQIHNSSKECIHFSFLTKCKIFKILSIRSNECTVSCRWFANFKFEYCYLKNVRCSLYLL